MVQFSYQVEIKHDGLNKYRVVRGTSKYIVEQKALAQMNAWNGMWERKQNVEERRLKREKHAIGKEAKKKIAIQKTDSAQEYLLKLNTLLEHTLTINDAINWNLLLDTSNFEEPEPILSKFDSVPIEPSKSRLNLGFFEFIMYNLSKKYRHNKEAKAQEYFDQLHNKWKEEKKRIEANNFKKQVEYDDAVKMWKTKRNLFLERLKKNNALIEEKKKAYLNMEPESILEYCEMVLSNSDYPEYFPKQYDIDYNSESKLLIVDYSLPSKEAIPTLKEVKYIATRDDFKESHITENKLNSLYDSILYQMTLRTIHELFEADVIDAVNTIVFNGIVDYIDKSTGKDITACILSLQTDKPAFTEINLEKVDPKACFKALKGVGSAKLHGLVPIAPILVIEKEDKRFVEGYGVTDNLDDSTNLASMDWQDFENLIRELFEEEFSKDGGEVKITQASRDGGVDAVAFDPDPIRGGKIVIQAKRYTNVVGVSAVRDLYGTVLNEGAIKGILVTTSNYGNDAYEFAKGKPLTLLNGGNLLSLLDKFGHKARIDLKEAKQFRDMSK